MSKAHGCPDFSQGGTAGAENDRKLMLPQVIGDFNNLFDLRIRRPNVPIPFDEKGMVAKLVPYYLNKLYIIDNYL